ncbi:DUF2188 domain-containing protein [Coralloluteibacterium stylophorae]|uniref:DUF2188 domain-containing protein n=1 Tax=Coralloluteibacterium stylophorae TaxID=1776034 RepID=A0A8J7VTX7_9GAMM|nr:DUF2188 domain-containing protein [Coralloluteibacterium stylophorae]MBS7456213.1 DUF2188 domain-containing protein [Coralloluteibacterium stylophorae]
MKASRCYDVIPANESGWQVHVDGLRAGERFRTRDAAIVAASAQARYEFRMTGASTAVRVLYGLDDLRVERIYTVGHALTRPT